LRRIKSAASSSPRDRVASRSSAEIFCTRVCGVDARSAAKGSRSSTRTMRSTRALGSGSLNVVAPATTSLGSIDASITVAFPPGARRTSFATLKLKSLRTTTSPL